LVSLQCSFELVRLCPIDPPLLTVARRNEPQLDHRATGEDARRQEIAPIYVKAIRREEIDLICGV
jgi:hypothetical protein